MSPLLAPDTLGMVVHATTVQLQLPREVAWLLGAFTVIGLVSVALGVVETVTDIKRALHARFNRAQLLRRAFHNFPKD